MKDPVERFLSKISKNPEPGCWMWVGTKTPNGYGIFSVGRKRQMAHRFAYELMVGQIQDGLTIDHLCRNRLCVNPEHLEPVTNKENILRGVGHTAINAKKTHCPHGHEYTTENTHNGHHGSRQCRACAREYQKTRYRNDEAYRFGKEQRNLRRDRRKQTVKVGGENAG